MKSNLPVTAKNKEQKDFARALNEHPIIFCMGSSGTGKTFLTIGIFLQKLFAGELHKIIISRPMVETGSRRLGHLPGDLDDKTSVYWVQVREYISHLVNDEKLVKRLYDEKRIEFRPLEIMRGQDFKMTGVLLTEAQNAEYAQLKMLLTRIGDDATRVVIDGDIEQTDLRFCDLSDVIKNLVHLEEVSVIRFIQSFRHPVVDKVCKYL